MLRFEIIEKQGGYGWRLRHITSDDEIGKIIRKGGPDTKETCIAEIEILREEVSKAPVEDLTINQTEQDNH